MPGGPRGGMPGGGAPRPICCAGACAATACVCGRERGCVRMQYSMCGHARGQRQQRGTQQRGTHPEHQASSPPDRVRPCRARGPRDRRERPWPPQLPCRAPQRARSPAPRPRPRPCGRWTAGDPPLAGIRPRRRATGPGPGFASPRAPRRSLRPAARRIRAPTEQCQPGGGRRARGAGLRAAPLPFLALTRLNSSQSPSTRFMCLSNAMNVPTSMRLRSGRGSEGRRRAGRGTSRLEAGKRRSGRDAARRRAARPVSRA